MSRKCILVRASKLNWEAEQGVEIEAIGPFDNWDHAGEWREYLGEPLSNEYVIVKLKSAVSKQKELDLGEMPSFDEPDPSQPHWPDTKPMPKYGDPNYNSKEEKLSYEAEDEGHRAADHLDEVKAVERMNKVKEGKA